MVATSGRGTDVAEYRLVAAKADPDPLAGVAHVLDAIEALSLHLLHVEAAADLFRREMQGKRLPRLSRASQDDLRIAAK